MQHSNFIQDYFIHSKNEYLKHIFENFIRKFETHDEEIFLDKIMGDVNNYKTFQYTEDEFYLFIKTDIKVENLTQYFWIKFLECYYNQILGKRYKTSCFYDVILQCMILGGWIYPNFYESLNEDPFLISVLIIQFCMMKI